MARPRVAIYLALSLDGFIAREDGALDWLDRVQAEGEDYGYADFLAGVDAVLLGRKTFDTVLGFGAWPYEGKAVYVLSSRALGELPGFVPRDAAGPARVSGPIEAVLGLISSEGRLSVYLDGGETARQALAAGLVDEMTLSLVPTLLGRGRPLFGPELPFSEWELLSARSFPSGLVQARYAPAKTAPRG